MEEKFLMKQGNIYTKVRYHERIGRHDKYVYHCSKCSVEDPELWYEGSIVQYDYKAKVGMNSCGCAKRRVYTEKQYKVLVKRKCKELGYKFHGFVDDGKRIQDTTNIILSNKVTGNKWDTTRLINFLRGKAEDPSLRGSKIGEGLKREDQYMVNKFLDTGKYHKDTTFERNLIKIDSQGRKCFWDVVCGECGEDYTSPLRLLSRGNVGCSCKKGGGFDNNKDGRIYVCLWYNSDVKYLKFGITNLEVMVRIKDQQRLSKNLKHKLLFTSEPLIGHKIRELETLLKEVNKHQIANCPKELLPDGYTETIPYSKENLNSVLQFIDKYFKNS
ncbi:hypothetical protein [Vibrio phage vB_VibM_10AMN]|uniref:CapR homology domain-containing protein n=1 Tax=Staphylococcus phage vB_VibM_10AMN12 TaxID=3076785 RepID=A0AA96R3N8_9CAUD|nr:hypothetical protein [Vibrio phage vB_VibM_10AMN]WNO47381.1 hypothetical protein [Staphylococcus phage vB_VibM_10AMN12]